MAKDPASIERLPRLASLDGLRAISAIVVVAYHASPALVPGGWLGVNIFFVLSGFLITHLLLVEHATTGSIDLPRFWRRRIRRLVPPVAVMLAVYVAAVIVARLLFGTANPVLAIWTMVASLLNFVNWLLIEPGGFDGAIGHLWSLAVEEQFYLVWPVLLAVTLRLRSTAVPGLIMVGALASVGGVVLMNAAPRRLYFGSEMHVAELLIGAALAYLYSHGRLRERAWHAPAGRGAVGIAAIGMAACIATIDFLDPAFFSPAVYLAFAVAAALVICGLVLDERSLLTRVCGHRLMAAIGLRSYSLYLVHHPIERALRYAPTHAWTGSHLAVTFAVSAVAAELLHRMVEQRSLHAGPAPRQRSQDMEPRRRLLSSRPALGR